MINWIILRGDSRQTVCGRAWENRHDVRWRRVYWILNWIFFFQEDHCRSSFINARKLINTDIVHEEDIQLRVDEMLEGREDDLEEWKASEKLCKSSRPNSSLGASALSSCKSQGFRRREGSQSHKIGKKRVKTSGKKIKGEPYGGPIPDYSEPKRRNKGKKKKS